MSSVFPPGVQLAARYRVLRVLETNPVGALFEAERLDTRRKVALKWLRFGAGHMQLALQRVARARAALAVRHPHLAVVHEVEHEGSSLFVVSELLQGEPLRARLAPHAMPLHERLRALADAGRAVAFAHQKGAVHGGLHPNNIFLHREYDAWVGLPAVVKVHDFGTATNTMPECLAHPAERSLLGAHAFLDHAQLCGAEPDVQSDIYAFGVLLFHALTGSVPYAAKSPIELAVALASSPVPKVGDRHEGLPAALDALIHQCLQHRRDERPKRLDLLAVQVSAYAEALAARELLAADDSRHTRRLVLDPSGPGPQATRLLTRIIDEQPAGALPVSQPSARPALASTQPGTRPLAGPDHSACVTLEVLQSDIVLETCRPPMVIGEAPDGVRPTGAQRAGYVQLMSSMRLRQQQQQTRSPEPTTPVFGRLTRSLQSPRGRAWSAAAGGILALVGISTSLAITTAPEGGSLRATPSVYSAQPAPHRRRRDPLLVDAHASSARGPSSDAPALPARQPSSDAPADSAREHIAHETPERPALLDRQATSPVTGTSGPAAAHPLEQTPASFERERAPRLQTRPIKLGVASNRGYRAGTPPTQDQF